MAGRCFAYSNWQVTTFHSIIVYRYGIATTFCAGGTSRFHELLFRGFSLCATRGFSYLSWRHFWLFINFECSKYTFSTYRNKLTKSLTCRRILQTMIAPQGPQNLEFLCLKLTWLFYSDELAGWFPFAEYIVMIISFKQIEIKRLHAKVFMWRTCVNSHS